VPSRDALILPGSVPGRTIDLPIPPQGHATGSAAKGGFPTVRVVFGGEPELKEDRLLLPIPVNPARLWSGH